MPTNQVQLRRDTATNLNAATPVDGELGYDTTNDRLVIGDGTTAGGIKIPNFRDIQKQIFTYSTVGGTANAITLTNSPVVLAYTNGLKLSFKATSTNTAATTVNVDGLGVKNIYKLSGTSLVALSGSEIISGAIYDITYDGTQFQLTNSGSGGTLSVVQQVFSSSGTYTPTANMKYCVITGVGGGGGGGAGSATIGGAGGGAGGTSRNIRTAATIGASQVVTIGGAGSGGVYLGAAASSGGTTSLGTLLTAGGGSAGNAGTAGGAVAGNGGTGDITGGDGNGGLTGSIGATGGASSFGGGGKGGVAGKAYGSGGGGGGATINGGAGKAGYIEIIEYCYT